MAKVVLFLEKAANVKLKKSWDGVGQLLRHRLSQNGLRIIRRLKLQFLPSYAPNLNLIERFYRFVKKHFAKNTCYKKYKTFRAKVFRFLNHVNDYIDELSTLMVEKFEIMKA